MIKFYSIFILSTVFFFGSVSLAEEDKHRNGWWLGTFSKKSLQETWSLWTETQLRYNLDDQGTQQILFRTGALQKLNEQHELGYLYAYIQSSTLKEHRYTFQHSQKYGRWGGQDLSHRARIEFRTLEDSDDDAGRFRYLLRAQSELTEVWKLALWNEVFLNLTNDQWTGEQTFERNRLFLGARRSFYDSNIELGYLNQHVPRKNQNTYEHLLVVYFFF